MYVCLAVSLFLKKKKKEVPFLLGCDLLLLGALGIGLQAALLTMLQEKFDALTILSIEQEYVSNFKKSKKF